MKLLRLLRQMMEQILRQLCRRLPPCGRPCLPAEMKLKLNL
jgi:hypothetical protein